MIKKLRQKFVMVTMVFMMATLGALLLANNISMKYWQEQEIVQELEWYAESDSFFEFDLLAEEYDKPIFAIELDKELHIQNIQASLRTGGEAPSEEEISAIFSRPLDKNKWKSYRYIIKEQADGYLLVITDTSEGKGAFYRALSNFFLLCTGFSALLLVSLFLSRFVTEPAKNALEREKQFISDASHELKTPLAAISINAQVLQTEFSDNKYLRNILSETRRMNLLIQKLLRLSYLEEAGSNIEKKLFTLSRSCEETALSMESSIFEQKIKFSYEIEENVTYCGNEEDIKQVIVILLDNAIKHTPKLGTIIFELKRNHVCPVMLVKNSGQGIPPEDLPHIFERFYQIDKSRNNSSDSYGLGLAIAKAILDAHGAKINVESEYGKGAAFIISFTS